MNDKPLCPAAFVATLGTQPQVITVALDLLLDEISNEEVLEEVLVIHTASSPPRPGTPPPTRDPMAESLRALRGEFVGGKEYRHRGTQRHRCHFRTLQLEVEGRPIDDVHSDTDARAVFTALFNEVQELKRRRYIVHLSIAGGRKSMSVYGMATAQLLFDSRDRLYHLFSSPEFENLGLMHSRGPEDAWLVPIPVLPISTVFPGMVTLLTSPDPLTVLDNKLVLMDLEGRRDRQQFMTRLTDAEQRLVKALMRPIVSEGRPPKDKELARHLVVTPRTVTKRFCDIYSKLREHVDALPEERVDRTVLVYYLAPYFAEHPAL
jgi:CRISPR-associated protein (TIGR02584 family)